MTLPKEHLLDILESISDGFISIDNEYVINFFNKAAEEMLGRQRAEVLNRNLFEAFPEAKGSIFEEKYREAVREKHPLSFETFFPVPPYANWYEVRVCPSAHGLAIYFLVITARKEDEEKLRQINTKFMVLADSIPGHIAYVNATTLQYEFVNIAFERSFGIPRAQIIGSDVEKIIGAKNFQFALPYINEVRSGRALSYENTFELASGKRWIEVNYTPVFDGSGRVSSIAVLSYDITEHKQVEETLKKSEEKFRSLFNNSEIAMFRTRLDGSEVLAANQKWLELVGKTPQEVLGRPSTLLWAEPKEREKMLARLIAEGSVAEFEFDLLTAEKGVRHCSTTLRLYPEEGILEGSIVDISERKRAAAEQARLQEQLNQAQKMEVVGRLAGGIAHDFNNMLTVILGYAEILKISCAKERDLLFLNEIEAAATRSRDLTRQLLAFSRKQVISPKELDLNAFIVESQKMLARVIGEDIRLTLHLAGDLGLVLLDPSQIDQILLNLAVNGRDAMADGGELVFTTGNVLLDEAAGQSYPEVAPGPYVKLAVRDNGHGMGEEILRHLFEPFFSTKGVGKGTGLGLATVYGIVKQNGGHIEVRSELGQGTTFTLYFPRIWPAAVATASPVVAEPLATGSDHILLVEDDQIVRDLLLTMLQTLGYQVVIAASAEEALALFAAEQARIDLLLTDIILPGMNGNALSKRLLAAKPGLKVLFISGYTSDVIAAKGVLEEGVNFLQKPFSLLRVGQKIKMVMG